MAEAVVTFLLQKLSDLIEGEANLLLGVDEQINSLRDELEWIHSFLRDADGKRKENERARVWVNQVRDVAYHAEDVIDEFILTVELRRRRSTTTVMGSLRSCVSSTNQLKALHNLGNQIEKIKKRVEEISANKSKYGIEAIQLGEPSSTILKNQGSSSSNQKSVPFVEEADAVGIEDDAKMMVRKLVEGETRLSVISIVGMGGLGKTTLAKKVYNNTDVRQYFKCSAWICLSQEYSVREVLEGILKQIRVPGEGEKEKLGEMNEQELGMEVFGCLNERRYLVVVDDIWSREAWDNLESVFPEGMKGSRVMLTTRNKEIALYADIESTPYELQFLNEGNCWELFCRKAFPKSARSSCLLSPDLKQIGREIVAKCGGLPLAVVVLGGLLSRKEKLASEWAKVLKQMNRQSYEGQSQISRILALSYNDLPYYLKSCFLYLGVFPEDFEIPSRKLIQLWVAEGLVEQRRDETMEEVAEEYLEELILRSMVQTSKRRSNGKIKSCRIHDLLRDLSITEGKEDKFLDVQRSVDFASPARARRLTIHGSIDRYISLNRPTPHLRSLLRSITELNGEQLGKEHWRFLFGGFKLLRVLDLPRIAILKLPKEVGEMIHLRYLGLRKSSINRLPSTISNLANLQTLDIKSLVSHIQRIPSSISKMNQLRHLYVDRGRMCGRPKINGLRNLQTLLMIEAGSWIEDGLGELTNLRKLGIRDALDSHKKALFESIFKLDHIKLLRLHAKDDNTLPTLMLSNHVHLYKLQLYGRLKKLPDLHELPPNLTYLSLGGSLLMHDPIATLEKLPHLRYLALFNKTYMGRRMVCTTSGFPRLEELWVSGLTELEEWQIEKEAMLRLRCLIIRSCYNLKTLPEELGNMPELTELKLQNMPSKFNDRILRDNGEEFRN